MQDGRLSISNTVLPGMLVVFTVCAGVYRKSMRISDYIIYLRLPGSGKYLLVHGYTGAVDLVQPNVVEYLKHFEPAGKSNGISSATTDALVKRGYLTDMSHEEEVARVKELAEFLHRRRLRAEKWFLLIPSYNCNFACPYCYEGRISAGGTNWSRKTMSGELVDSAYAAIKAMEPDNAKRRGIVLYGGEPLMAENYDAVRYILERGMRENYVFIAVTNGYDLDRYRDFLGKGKIAMLQVSLDGSPESHNRRRHPRSGADSFRKIADNITMALDAGARVSVRVNLDKENLSDLRLLNALFVSRGWIGNEKFRYYVAAVFNPEKEDRRANNLAKGSLVKSALGERRVCEDLSELRVDDFGLEAGFAAAFTDGGLVPFRANFCSAQEGTYIFDPVGDIYSCWQSVGIENERVGRYFPVFNIDEASVGRWRDRCVSVMPDCPECKYALFCGGGCEGLAYLTTGSHYNSYCDDFPNAFAHSVPAAYSNYLLKKKTLSLTDDDARPGLSPSSPLT